ncbi:DoxX family protein [Caldimonas sp. KR1-144]|uniref:DoxX family protein n=1 Tax=Caldimonas sp. KR1-144 TaxID=3400911 RepID=UPI003C0C3C57
MPIEAQALTTHVLWTGRVLSGLAIAFLLLDAAMKLVPLKPVIDAMQGLGFAGGVSLARGLGALLLACTLLYALPRTAPLGALLLTGYLGGAMAVQLRAGNPLFSHVLFGAYIGLALWAGLLLRSAPLRSMLLQHGQ